MRKPAARSQTLRALIALRQRVVEGELPGGARLFEVPLAAELKISRTPLRAAMARLAEEGLLERARGGGYAVRRFALTDVLDTIELRGTLEGHAARLAAERGAAPGDLAALHELLDALDECFGEYPDDPVNLSVYAELNLKFHAALARLPGSAVIERELARVTHLPFASPSAFLPDTAHLAAFNRSLVVAQAQHRAIVEAIAARQGARAESLAREHAGAAQTNLRKAFQSDRGAIRELPGLALVAP